MDYADQLWHNGVVVVCPEWSNTPAKVAKLRREFEADVVHWPEFKRHPTFNDVSKDWKNAEGKDAHFTLEEQTGKTGKTKNKKIFADDAYLNRYSLSGTSFIGNPSAFHCMFVRRMRNNVMHTLIEQLFRPYIQRYKPGMKLEQVMDRVMIRPAGDVASAESWHRDLAPRVTDADVRAGDQVFGGWMNFDDNVQQFGCIVGTHKSAPARLEGFYKVDTKSQEYAALHDHTHRVRVQVGSGCIIVFAEDLLHHIFPRPLKYTSVRQFFGWRITHHNDALFGRKYIQHVLATQGETQIKSNQWPRLWSKQEFYQKGRKEKWMAANLTRGEDAMYLNAAKDPAMKGLAAKGEKPFKDDEDMDASMKSLADQGLQLHPAYSADEMALLFPAHSFTLINPTTGKREEVSLRSDPGHHPVSRLHYVKASSADDKKTKKTEGETSPSKSKKAKGKAKASPSKRSPKGKTNPTRKSPHYSSSESDDLQADRDAIARMEQDEQDRRDAAASGATSSKAPVVYDIDDSDDDVVYLHTNK